jgi:hypothetical protein
MMIPALFDSFMAQAIFFKTLCEVNLFGISSTSKRFKNTIIEKGTHYFRFIFVASKLR